MSTVKANVAIKELQKRYMLAFVAIIAAFVIVYVTYLMGGINYFHGWLMRGLCAVFAIVAIYAFIRYLIVKNTLTSQPRRR